MLSRIFRRKVIRPEGLFNGHYYEVKALYTLYFDTVCNLCFIGEIDASRAFAFIKEQFQNDIVAVYQHNYFSHDDDKVYFNNTIFVLKDKRMVELAGNYCQILYTRANAAWADRMIGGLSAFREKQDEKVIGFARQTVNSN